MNTLSFRREEGDEPIEMREFVLTSTCEFSYPPPVQYIRDKPKVGRNEPCPCGSGKKYKHCCMGKEGGTNERIAKA